MNLDDAVAIGTDCTHGALLGISQETRDALHLLIEAGKREQQFRRVVKPRDIELLPGETKD